MNEYHLISDLKSFYLEDSYVNVVQFDGEQLSFNCEVVLLESHAAYRPPNLGEQYCYMRCKIIFQGVKHLKICKLLMSAYHDASGSCDFGNFDVFEFEDDEYHLAGDWGEMNFVSSQLKVEMFPD